jgi:hypothetical protein
LHPLLFDYPRARASVLLEHGRQPPTIAPTPEEPDPALRLLTVMRLSSRCRAGRSQISSERRRFVQTGASASQKARSANNGARALSLESSIPGVFAVGDARSGSVKRVGAAIGEGAGVVAQTACLS